MIDILMPRLSDTMEEGAVATWHKQPGDAVAVGDILVEIETDKAMMEYEAYEAGTFLEALVAAGGTAAIGAVIARLDDGKPAIPAAVVAVGAPSPAAIATAPLPAAPASTPRSFSSPLARKEARENGIDVSALTGSGPGGRIVRSDVLDAVTVRHDIPQPPSTDTAVAAPDGRRSRAIPFDKTRQVISRRLSESSSTVPHFFVTAEADVEELLALRGRINAELNEADRPKISVNDLVVRACAMALRAHPGVNASFADVGGGQTLIHDRVNVGVAIASETGLVVPVIQDSDQKTVSQIGLATREFARLAQQRKLSPAALSDGTFTISNLGMFGTPQFTAIINPPEGAILAVGAALRMPAAVGDEIVLRHRMKFTLSADHRIIDGALAAQFLAALTGLLERPLTIVA